MKNLRSRTSQLMYCISVIRKEEPIMKEYALVTAACASIVALFTAVTAPTVVAILNYINTALASVIPF